MDEEPTYECLIIGAGPVGLAMARALEVCRISYCLCGELPQQSRNSPDLRTAALFGGSIRLLGRLSVWQDVREHAAEMRAIRIIDATGHLLRAPEQIFTANDLSEPYLAYNVPNPALVEALSTSLTSDQAEGAVRREINLPSHVTSIDLSADMVSATLACGARKHARMAIAADGRNSVARKAAGISVRTWDHDQAAITAHFDHALSNDAISTEIHTRTGPCTVVPLGPHRSSLVWMDTRDAATERANLADADFITALEDRLSGLLGPVHNLTPRRIFPLSSLIADRFGENRVALIGESGHAFPPIGAQGLNLGLRDVASLADHLMSALKNGADPGARQVLKAYSADRRADIAARIYGVDAFNISLSNRAAGLIRGAILHATKASPAIKRFLLSRGVAPVGAWPTLMK